MKNQNPLISIITPSYNQGQFIEETILSVLNQTYKNIEYLIIDGNSNDNTMEIVEKYKNKISLVIHEKDEGQTDAINKGFKLAKGNIVGWINSDDILHPTCVEEIVKLYIQFPEGKIFYNCNNHRIDEKGNKLGEYTIKINDKNDLLNNNYSVIQQGSFYSHAAVKKANYLDPKLHYCMDLDLWFRLLNFGSIHYIDISPTSAFRVYNTTKTSTGGDKFLKEIRETLKKNGAFFLSSKALRQTYWYEFKVFVKNIVLR